MRETSVPPLADLLRQAGAAHGEYETTVLNGVYDEAWPMWYADWLLAHGFNDHVRTAQTPETLSHLLDQLNKEHRASGSTQHWADYYADRIGAMLG